MGRFQTLLHQHPQLQHTPSPLEQKALKDLHATQLRNQRYYDSHKLLLGKIRTEKRIAQGLFVYPNTLQKYHLSPQDVRNIRLAHGLDPHPPTKRKPR